MQDFSSVSIPSGDSLAVAICNSIMHWVGLASTINGYCFMVHVAIGH